MKRESLIFFLGVVLVLLPFSGIPSMWKRIVSIALGVVLMVVGYQLRRLAYLRSIGDHTGERKTDVYVEQVEVFAAVNDERDLLGIPAEVANPAELPKTRTRRVRTKTNV